MNKIVINDNKSEQLDKLIAICKSDSQSYGKPLRDAHYELGKLLANEIIKRIDKHLTIIVLLRAGLFFAEGIADKLEELKVDVSILMYCSTEDWLCKIANNKCFIDGQDILLADAVINSGKSILKLADNIPSAKKIMFATNVIQEETLVKFAKYDLFAIRSSKNKYIGTKIHTIKNGLGPDTGDRLFNTIDNIKC